MRGEMQAQHRAQMDAIRAIEGDSCDPGDEHRRYIFEMQANEYSGLRTAAFEHLKRFHADLCRRVEEKLDLWEVCGATHGAPRNRRSCTSSVVTSSIPVAQEQRRQAALMMQASHLAIQEFYCAKAICEGVDTL